METFEMLCEQMRDHGQRITANVEYWLDCRIKHSALQQDSLDEYIHRMRWFRQNLVRAANRDTIGWDMTIEELDCYLQGIKQKWQCAITGDPLEFVRGGMFMGTWTNANSCSVDRVDSKRGYVQGNIQLVTWQANLLKNKFSMTDLQTLVEKAYKTLCQNH